MSPGRRLLLRGGIEVPVIPRYFDVLVLLIERRHEAVHRIEIIDRVWTDVVVSDGALSQAVRTLRRALGEDPRVSRFIRTVARYGYQFVFPGVVEEDDGAGPAAPGPAGIPAEPDLPANALDSASPARDPFEPLLEVLLEESGTRGATDEERRDAATQLHALGTAEALRHLDRRAGHDGARAFLRETRWDVAGAGEVPLLGPEGSLSSILAVVRLRLREAARLVASRWAGATLGGAGAGALAGLAGGLVFLLSESGATASLPLALALVGAAAGAVGACGIGAALAATEALARSARTLALLLAGAVAGAATGALAHAAVLALLSAVFGLGLGDVGGWAEGLSIGMASGAGYAIATRGLRGGGLATPRHAARVRAALLAGACCAVGGLAVALAGGRLVGASLDLVASGFDGSQVGLGPIARWLGEQEFRPVTRAVVSAFEGLMFGTGLVAGLTHRPRPPIQP